MGYKRTGSILGDGVLPGVLVYRGVPIINKQSMWKVHKAYVWIFSDFSNPCGFELPGISGIVGNIHDYCMIALMHDCYLLENSISHVVHAEV